MKMGANDECRMPNVERMQPIHRVAIDSVIASAKRALHAAGPQGNIKERDTAHFSSKANQGPQVEVAGSYIGVSYPKTSLVPGVCLSNIGGTRTCPRLGDF
jgi:hypothetical protein